ncbi:titin-like isoform X3 [Phlebotomus papatasi]|uniref:titin-like isoform X3 n=1 Tax=Phlebotomus papatasi TaxID=29031 RepID=UPI0024841FB9|nr:titin-like isoform X3 [Phlebotomus papatasi]
MSIEALVGENCENAGNSEYDRVILSSDRDDHAENRLTLDDYRRILRELDQNRDLQNRRREKLSQVSQRRNLRKKRASDANQETSTRSSSCYLCNIRVALEDITTFAVCRGCDRTVCRGKRCSDWDRGTGYWECVSCIRNRDSQIRAGEWILDQLNQRFKSPQSDTSRDDLSFKDAETQSDGSFLGSAHSISLEQKEKVREFLEEVIASMIGGSLDSVPVNQIYKHPSYLPLQEDGPAVAHVNLKRLIQKVIEEALNLPDLFNFSGYPQPPESHLPYFSTKKYEQLLATAVLNKVIDHYRNPKNHQENSSGIQSGSEFDSNHNALSDKTAVLSPISSQKALDKRLEEASQTSESSLKTRSTESDETYLSDYIQKHRVPLPDLSAASSESTVDDNSSEILSTAGTEGTWEENWLFKKRKVKTETNSTAIGMLVPSPTEEVKALIGDKNVDEVSDLSEAGSDAEEDTQDRPATKLIESKTIIGGKNELISLEDTSSATDSLLSNPDSGINVTEAKNEVLVTDGDFAEAPQNTNPTQAINENIGTVINGTDIPIPTPRQSAVTEKVEENHVLENHELKDQIQEETVSPSSSDFYKRNYLWELKPENLPQSDNLPNSPNFPGDWVLIQGCWEVRDPNESILINAGQYTAAPVALTPEEIKDSMNHQVLHPDQWYGYRYLNELKPDTLPVPEGNVIVQGEKELETQSVDSQIQTKLEKLPIPSTSQNTQGTTDKTLPTPEIELSNTDDFVCVMKYDEKRQLIVCESPKAKRKVTPEDASEAQNPEILQDSNDWEPQVCETVDDDVKETPPAAEDDVVFQGNSTKIVEATECHKSPVPLPRTRSVKKSQGEENSTLEATETQLTKTQSENRHQQMTENKTVQIHQSKIEQNIKEEKVIEQSLQVKKSESHESKQKDIHIKVDNVQEHVEIVQKTENVQKIQENRIEVKTEQVLEEKRTKNKEKVQDSTTRIQQELNRAPEIHLKTLEVPPEVEEQKKNPEVDLKTVGDLKEDKDNQNSKSEPPKSSSEVHLRMEKVPELEPKVVPKIYVKTEEVSKEPKEVPEIHVETEEIPKEPKEIPEIHVRTQEVPKEPKEVPEIHVRAQEVSKEPKEVPEIQVRTEEVSKEPKEAPKIQVKTEEVSKEPKEVPEIHARTQEVSKEPKEVPEILVRTEEVSKESKEVPEIHVKTEEVSKEPKEVPEIHVRTEEVSKEPKEVPEIHVRTEEVSKEPKEVPEIQVRTEAVSKEPKAVPEIQVRTQEVSKDPKEVPEIDSKLPKVEITATAEVPEIHVKTEAVSKEPKEVPEIHVKTEEVSKEPKEVPVIDSKLPKEETTATAEVPEIHVRTEEVSKEPIRVPEDHLKTEKASVNTKAAPEVNVKIEKVSEDPKDVADAHLKTEANPEEPKMVPEIHVRTNEVQVSSEPKEVPEIHLRTENISKEGLNSSPEVHLRVGKISEEPKSVPEAHARIEQVSEESKDKNPKSVPESHARTVKEEPEMQLRNIEAAKEKEPELVSQDLKHEESRRAPEIHVTRAESLEVKEPEKSREIHVKTDKVLKEELVEGPKTKEINVKTVEVSKEITVNVEKTTKKTTEIQGSSKEIISEHQTKGVSDEELNAKIDEILKEDPPTEAGIMSTSLEIKEQLQKIVKTSNVEQTQEVERPKTLNLEAEPDDLNEEQVHLRYKSPIFQDLLPKSPPSVVKLSEIPNDELSKLISVANIIKRSSLQSPEEPDKGLGGGSTKHVVEDTNIQTNQQQEKMKEIPTNVGSIETVSKSRTSETLSQSPEPDSLEEEHLIPGSIAEREHLKWQHPDADIPNNPYSPEALQQRLVGKTYHSQSTTGSTTSNIESPPKTPERSLQVVLGENSPDYKRYGRDYYINDAKKSSGTRKKQMDIITMPSEEDKSGVFVATPIRVDESEVSGDSLTRISIDSSETSNTSLQLTDSLTPSEDSDTTRIYEIETRETRLLRQSVILSAKKPIGSTRTPPSTPTEEDNPPPTFPISPQAIQEETSALREIEEETLECVKVGQKEKVDEIVKSGQKKSISPETVKFFTPKKPPVFTATTPTTPEKSVQNGSSGIEKKKEINNNDVVNKMVIEEEVLSTLPSVKKLMSTFSAVSNQADDTKKPIPNNRPKSLPLQTDQEASKAPENGKKSSPSNGKSPMVPGYSITARSLSKQFRDELKHSTSQEDETPPETRTIAKEEEKGKRHSSPERPPSPVLVPGRLKNNIAFFENLRKK